MAASEKRRASGRRVNALGVHSLDSVVYAAPDLKLAETFHKSFGLGVRHENAGLALYAEASGHRWVSVVEGPKKRLHHLSFGLFEEDLAPFAKRMRRLGVERIDSPRGFESNGIWLKDHDGTPVEVKVAEKVSPSRKPAAKLDPQPAGAGAAPRRSLSGHTRPQRLSHTLLFSSSVPAAINFYTRVLGLRVSDRSADDIVFLHAPHGSDHHVVAFCRSGGPGLHHTSWAVRSVHEIGLGAERMREAGYDKGWGLGRHVLGSNYFHYVRDPWGSYSEYSFDIDFIPADVTWRSGDYGPEDSFYVWGPQPPSDFVVNYELA